jgi:2-(1,2-epoxy-1,2-dihydrophenyl)acetyl-CoA isomerase
MTVIVTDSGAVRVLEISRPERRNAMNLAVVAELLAGVEDAGREDGIGAVVLTGAGGHFSAGGDADAILDVTADPDDRAPLHLMRSFHRLVEAIWTSELPVVAAVAGSAYGGGFNLALACDLIVSAADAKFCQVFLRRGLVPDLGGAYLLPRLVGMQRAKELMLLTSEIDAARAAELGLVNEVLPTAAAARDRACELAARLAAGPRAAIGLTKKLVNASTTGTLQQSLELEAVTQSVMLRTDTVRQGFEQLRTRRSAPAAPGGS